MNTLKRLPLQLVVAPLDLKGTSSSLPFAMAIARAHDAELRAVHVVPADPAAEADDVGSIEREVLMDRLRKSLAEVDSSYRRVGAAVRVGDPATHILQFARSRPADLIVMGAPIVDQPERPFGPVASVVIARSDCSVLAIPRGYSSADATGVFSRIVCAVDPAPSSSTVIRQALSLAWETGARLMCVCVVPSDTVASASGTAESILAAIPSDAQEWCEIDVVVTDGTPGREVIRRAEEQDSDLVVIGAPRRWTSTTHDVLGESRWPVLVAHDARPLPWPG